MPVYEEKLICPFALRFTQEHIKTHFRDGRLVEETVDEIVASAGVGDYDAVLEAPFPDIEIIRWSGGRAGSERHWFTLDNRRLYCLQRAAVLLWPKRIAAKVQILYTADPEHVRRKYDSTTFGASVTVSPSCKVAALFRWDWRLTLPEVAAGAETLKAWTSLTTDDTKDTVDDLMNMPGSGSEGSDILERALSALEEVAARKASRSSSTRAASSDSSSSPCSSSPPPSAPGARRCTAAEPGLAEKAIQEIKRQLRVPGNDGRVRVPRWNERYAETLGNMREFIESHPKEFKIVRERNGQFTVSLAGVPAAAEPAAQVQPKPVRQQPQPVPPTLTQPSPVAAAVAAAAARMMHANAVAWGAAQRLQQARCEEMVTLEIEGILVSQGGPAPAWIQDWWKNKYAPMFGPLRNFLETRPDKFLVVPTVGKGFRVASVGCMMAMRMGY